MLKTNHLAKDNLLKTQEELQTSEIRYRRLFESARDGILILDAVTLKITDVNPYMMEFLGYTRDEFIGREVWQIGIFSDKEENQAAFQELQETGYIRYEHMQLETKSGGCWDVEFVCNVYQEGTRQVIQCNIRDITARKRAEEASKASETKQRQLLERQSMILDAIPPHICLLNSGGDILTVNAAWRQFALKNKYSGKNFGIGTNYLEVCENAAGHRSAGAKQVAEGIRTVLSGKANHFELEYPCHSPQEERRFRLTVVPLQNEKLMGVVVMHLNVKP